MDFLPELSRFFGIIIRMYVEVGAPHKQPHFHAYYQDFDAVFQIEPIVIMFLWSSDERDKKIPLLSFKEGTDLRGVQ